MANARESGVWSRHAGQQMEMRAYDGSADETLTAPFSLTLAEEPWGVALDFGCGTGLWRDFFRAGRYVGLDQNPEMIAGARQRWAGDDAEFVLCPDLADGARMPFEDGTFDVVCCIAVLQHNYDSDKQKVLDEIRRVLRPGGRLLMYEGTYGDWNDGNDNDLTHTQEGWRNTIEPRGFVCVRQERDFHIFRAV